jgi:prepilin-type processing-associated H-X9-DG protein
MVPGWFRNNVFTLSDNPNKGIWKFAHGKGTKLKDILDGTSRTVLLSEVLPYDAGKTAAEDIRGVWVRASMGASTYSHATTPNSKVPDNINGCDAAATGLMKCIEVTRGTLQEGNTFAAARSSHSRGVNVVFADGSSKFFSNGVDPKIWKALATRNGGASESKRD